MLLLAAVEAKRGTRVVAVAMERECEGHAEDKRV